MSQSRLEIVIDSTDAKTNADDLARAMQALDDAGVRVTRSAKRSGQAAGEAGDAYSQSGKQARQGADGVDRLNKSMGTARQRTSDLVQSLSLRGAIAGSIFGISTVSVFNKFITETKNAQNEQSQLAAVLRSTGEAAGYSRAQLNQMASDLAQASVFSEGDINRAQTRLLSYTGIVGETFPRAMQAVIDTAQRMGMSVEQAAEVVGRALDVPSQGLSSLSRQGFRFTEAQEKLVKKLEDTGRVAEAQAIVLAALESSYGGAAAAARDTLGGALDALGNQVNSLMTGDDKSVNGLTATINELNRALGSDDTKAAFANFTGWLAELATTFTRASAAIGNSSFFGWLMSSGKDQENPDRAIAEIDETLAKVRESLRINREQQGKSWFHDLSLRGDESDLETQIAVLEKKREALMVYLRTAPNPYAGVGETGGSPLTLDTISVNGDPPSKKGEVDAGQNYIDQLRKRIALVGQETELEKLKSQIADGTLKFKTKEQQQDAIGYAQTMDYLNQQIKQEEVLRDLRAQQSTTQRQFMRELASYGQGDQVRELNAALAQVEDRYRTLIEQRRNSPLGLPDSELAQIRESLDVELGMVREHYAARHEIQENWRLGAVDSLRNYVDESRNLYESVGTAVRNGFSGMEEALTTFVTTGKLSFRSLANSIISDLARIAVRQSITGPLASALGGLFGNLGNGGFGSPQAPVGGYIPTLDLTGGLATGGPARPSSLYEVNERGPELYTTRGRTFLMSGADGGYVTPLTQSAATAGPTHGPISIVVNVQDGNATTSTSGDQQNQVGLQLAAAVRDTVRQELARSFRQGGMNWQQRNGRM